MEPFATEGHGAMRSRVDEHSSQTMSQKGDDSVVIGEVSNRETTLNDIEAGAQPPAQLSRREHLISVALHFLLFLTLAGAALGLVFLAGSSSSSLDAGPTLIPAADTLNNTSPPAPSLSPRRTPLEAMKAFLPGLPDDWDEIKRIQELSTRFYGIPVGTIPTEIGDLAKLRVISFPRVNGINGTIPTEIAFCWRLNEINLASNQITGTLPIELNLLRGLNKLDLSENELSGSISTNFGQMESLDVLNLQNNTFTGTLPSELGEMRFLAYMNVANNALTGPLPSELGTAPNLKGVKLANNGFTGTLPAQWGNLGNLRSLRIVNSFLTGTLPPEWSALSSLQYLFLQSNSLTGTLPPEWYTFPLLRKLFLDSNDLTGSIPEEWGDYESRFKFTLGLSDNRLTGTIPDRLQGQVQGYEFFSENSTVGAELAPPENETIGVAIGEGQ